MQSLKKYTPFFTSALLMYIVLYIIYPNYQYYIDPDGTAYLAISRRYAAGDFSKAINGYWSPWSCWLTALLIRGGFAAIPASVIINTLGATGFLYISQSFFQRFNIIAKLQWLLNITLALFLSYAVFWQSFDDLWECFFLLCTLRLMLADGFITRPWLWISCGLIGALAYFAKAYSFPFFILNTVCCTYFLTKGNKLQWLKVSAVCILVMLFGAHFWIMRLHEKYGIWTTSTAGSLNMSWYLIGHPHWKPGIAQLLPPAYPDSPSYWEDPYFTNGDTPHFWDSLQLFGLQLLRIGLNVYKFVISSLQLSVFFLIIFIISLASLFHKRFKPLFTSDLKLVIISFLLFPLGYFLINFESRYLWYMVPLSMVIGGTVIMQWNFRNRYLTFLVITIYAASYLITPPLVMSKLKWYGSQADELTYSLPKGSFTSNVTPGKNAQKLATAVYLMGTHYYSIPAKDISNEQLVAEINRYHIQYYVYFTKVQYDTTYNLIDKNGKPYPYDYTDKAGMIKVFKFYP